MTTTTDMVEVIQADRDAAASVIDHFGGIARFEKAGISFAGLNGCLVQAFARHRLAAEAAATERCAQVFKQAIADGYDVPARKVDQCAWQVRLGRLHRLLRRASARVDRRPYGKH